MHVVRFFFIFFLSIQAFADKNLSDYVRYSLEGPNSVGHLYIGGHESQISQATFVYVKNALDYYKEHRPICIILELDTPGGQLFPAQKISDALKEIDIQHGIPVIAFINNWAMSAGAMLAYSCRYIVIAKDAAMGAAQPITSTGEKTSEKVNSAVRADFANRAAFFDRNPLLAEAMVDADVILVIREGKILKLNEENEVQKEDVVLNRRGKLLTLNAKQMEELGVADFTLPAIKMEVANPVLSLPFFQKIPNLKLDAYKMDGKTRFLALLTSPLVTSLLFLGLIVSFYMELSHPGFGAPAIFGLICLSLILLSSYAIQAAGILEFLLLGVGIILIIVELFILPSFGIMGIVGIVLALSGLVLILLPGIGKIHYDFDTKTINAAGEYVLERLIWMAGALVIGAFVISILAKFMWPKLSRLSPFVLKESQVGYSAGLEQEKLPKIGSIGVANTALRTAGKVEIDNEIYDAVSSGKFIEKGEKIRVIQIEGSKMTVEEME